MTNKVYGRRMVDAKQVLAAAKAIQADADTSGMGAFSAIDPKRVQLLEAVAEAARAAARLYVDVVGHKDDLSFSEFVSLYSSNISEYRRPMLEALAALEAYDDT